MVKLEKTNNCMVHKEFSQNTTVYYFTMAFALNVAPIERFMSMLKSHKGQHQLDNSVSSEML